MSRRGSDIGGLSVLLVIAVDPWGEGCFVTTLRECLSRNVRRFYDLASGLEGDNEVDYWPNLRVVDHP